MYTKLCLISFFCELLLLYTLYIIKRQIIFGCYIIKARFGRYDNITNQFKLPMKYFTKDEIKPSEQTLNIIRQIAYSYGMMKAGGHKKTYCIN